MLDKIFLVLVLFTLNSRINSVSLPAFGGDGRELETNLLIPQRSKFINSGRNVVNELAGDKNFTYETCDQNVTYPLTIIYLSLSPYPLDFTSYVDVYYKLALLKPIVKPATLYLKLNLGFIYYTKKLDFCELLLENMKNMYCPLDKGVFEGKFKLSLRPYQIYGNRLNMVWANIKLCSGEDEEKFMCIKFKIQAKNSPYALSFIN